jgi:hypothetical protein
MSTPPVVPVQTTFDAEGRLAADTPCVTCGYNLRTLKAEAVCPECGTRVEHSLHGYLLKYASPAWLTPIARGSWLLVVTVALMVLAGLAGAAWGMFRAMSAPSGGGVPKFDFRTMSLASAPLAVLIVVGLVLFTTRNPADSEPGRDSAVRRWLRGGTWAYVFVTLLGWVFIFLPDSALALNTRSTLMALNGPLGIGVFTLIAVLGLRYAGQLMARVPRPGLVRFSRICFWGMLIGGTLGAVGQFLMMATNAQSIAAFSAAGSAGAATMPVGSALPFGPVTMILAGCGSCAGTVFYVASFVLLIMASTALSGAAREARQIRTPESSAIESAR